jgi:antitoxin component of MazEF toxin-antitoxin module
MEVFEAKPKAWGNSLGITIPKELLQKEGINTNEKIRVAIMGNKKVNLNEVFGSLKRKKSIDKIMMEIDNGWN